mgnify:CR=1 FL=1
MDETMRFIEDPVWGYELSLARKGIWSENLREIINGRFISTCQQILLNNVDIHQLLINSVVSLPDKNDTVSKKRTVFATPSNQ